MGAGAYFLGQRGAPVAPDEVEARPAAQSAAPEAMVPAPAPARADETNAATAAEPAVENAATAEPQVENAPTPVAASPTRERPSAEPAAPARPAAADRAPVREPSRSPVAANAEPAAPAPEPAAAAPREAPAPAPAAEEPPAPAVAEAPTNLPARPTREQVQGALEAVRPTVGQCLEGQHGTVRVRITVRGSGRVTTALVQDSMWAAPPTGSCIARAVRQARFPEFSDDSFVVLYPFAL